MSMAFRTHFFSLLILGQYARLIRWDRQGAIVSSRFDYVEHPDLIFNFYIRFGQLSLRQRGFDTHVQPVKDGLPSHVADAFDKYFLKSWYQGAKFSHKNSSPLRNPSSQMHFFRIRVENRVANRTDTFFIPSPAYGYSVIPFSRASRRSLAFLDDPSRAQMCFLKDSWQEVSERTSPEADIYRLVHAQNVPNIASMRLGGDVDGLETETQRKFHLLPHSGRYKHLGPMVCHRLVLDTVARDLSTFTWCKVLLSCLADAVDAAQGAYKAGVLHRDISSGNIMIVVNEDTHEMRGILIDWDMSLLLKQRDNGAIFTAKTGTWAFISARLLQPAESTSIMHTLSDDMESVFWVLVYEVLRYTKHNREPYPLYRLLKSLFDDATRTHGTVVRGDTKFLTLGSCAAGRVDLTFAKFEVKELKDVLPKLARVFNARYDSAESSTASQNTEEELIKRKTNNQQEEEPSDDDSEEESSSNDDEDDQGQQLPIKNLHTKDLDDPNEKWLSKCLRQSAKHMEPLGVTPTGLVSKKNNSRPPKDPLKRKPALPSEYAVDFEHMSWATHEHESTRAKANRVQAVTNSMFNHMNGQSFHSSGFKRPAEDDTHATERAASKKLRPFS